MSSKSARNITVIGMVANLLLSVVKFAVGFIGCSSSVVADAVHSLSDMASDVFVLFGIKFWSAPADDNHPYGHQRIETIAVVGIAALLIVVAIGIARASILNLGNQAGGKIAPAVIVAPILSIIVKEILYRRTLLVGQQIKSSAIVANAWHHRTDAMSSIPPLIAIVAGMINPKWSFLDAVGAFTVSLFIIKAAWDIASPAFAELSEKGASPENVEKIKILANGVTGVKSVHRVRTRRLGSSLFVDLHAVVNADITVRAGHDIADGIEDTLLENGPEVTDVTVHIEPDK